MVTVENRLIGKLEGEIKDLRDALSSVRYALVWAGGSYDFQEGGKAREGWIRVAQPALDQANDILKEEGAIMTLAEIMDAERLS